MATPVDLIITNVRVLTMDLARPRASLVAIREGRIVFVGEKADLDSLQGPGMVIVDGQGGTVTPGLIDAHLHLLAWAARLSSVDCGPGAVTSIREMQRAIAQRARDLSPGSWVRATGYDEFALAEKRHPTRHDLDAAAPRHPVRLGHRSGHIWVLNSRALELAGIRTDTPEPPGATIDREVPSGEPSGLLMEMDSYLRERIRDSTSEETKAGLSRVNGELLSYGVTFVQDATPSNDVSTWRDLLRYREDGILGVGVSMMAGVEGVKGLEAAGLAFRAAQNGVHIGAVKIVLSESSGKLYPTQAELEAQVRKAQRAGFQVAIHAVGAEAVDSAVSALEWVGETRPGYGLRHRLEHVSVCPPELLRTIREAGLGVVTQPAFLFYNGDRYLETVEEGEQPWLYRTTSFWRAGIPLAASSDAPVVQGDSRAGLFGAVARRARSGRTVGEREGLNLEEALALFTRQAAYLTFQERDRGAIAPGKRADLVLWDRDLVSLESPEEVLEARVVLTFIDGVRVYQATE